MTKCNNESWFFGRGDTATLVSGMYQVLINETKTKEGLQNSKLCKKHAVIEKAC